MQLPQEIKRAIEEEIKGIPLHELSAASLQLSKRYRTSDPKLVKEYMQSSMEKKGYLVTRLPATFAVLCKVLEESQAGMAEFPVKTILDLGAGPGTALLAVAETFPSFELMTCVEQDAELIAMGKRLACKQEGIGPQVKWITADILAKPKVAAHDLVILSYALGELAPDLRQEVVMWAWDLAEKMMIIIEPGTPLGYQRILSCRTDLLQRGAHLIAPCPHANACPIGQGDWCHFSRRVERDAMHRQVKGGSLGYEDEKYSYLIVAKSRPAEYRGYESRILREPEKHSGHASFTLCTAEGMSKRTISRRDGDLYKKAKKLAWGDAF